MSKKILLSIILTILLSSCKEKKDPSKFYVPAEFEEQEYIWLSWVETGFLVVILSTLLLSML